MSRPEPLKYACTVCGRTRKKSKPGLSGGRMVARCNNCRESTLWKPADDD